jgi:hypothetical protein
VKAAYLKHAGTLEAALNAAPSPTSSQRDGVYVETHLRYGFQDNLNENAVGKVRGHDPFEAKKEGHIWVKRDDDKRDVESRCCQDHEGEGHDRARQSFSLEALAHARIGVLQAQGQREVSVGRCRGVRMDQHGHVHAAGIRASTRARTCGAMAPPWQLMALAQPPSVTHTIRGT